MSAPAWPSKEQNGIVRPLCFYLLCLSVAAVSCSADSDLGASSESDPRTGDTYVDSLIANEPDSFEEVRAQVLEPAGVPVEARLRQAFEADVQDEISDCMAATGFDYVAWVPPSPAAPSPRTTFSSDFSPVDQRLDLAGLSLAGSAVVKSESVESELANPNDEIVAQLSDEDRSAYLDALWKVDGCGESAYSAVDARMSDLLGGMDEEFEEALNGINSLVAAHQDVVEAEDQFSECFREASGFEFRNENEMVWYFSQGIGRALDDYRQQLEYPDPAVKPDPAALIEQIESARNDERVMMKAYDSCIDFLGPVRDVVRREVTEEVLKEHKSGIEAILSE